MRIPSHVVQGAIAHAYEWGHAIIYAGRQDDALKTDARGNWSYSHGAHRPAYPSIVVARVVRTDTGIEIISSGRL